MSKNHLWTKEEIRKVAKLWDEYSVEGLSKELGVEPKHLKYIVARMRVEGFVLAKKRRNEYISTLLKEVLAETKK